MSRFVIAAALLISFVAYAEARSKAYLFGAEGVVIHCSAYQHNPDGSWEVIARTMIKGPWGTMLLTPGARFASGEVVKIGGIDLVATLDARCK